MFRFGHIHIYLFVSVDGGYGIWGSFGPCTTSCGVGKQYRRRLCDNPLPLYGGKDCVMLGVDVEMRTCNLRSCPGNYNSFHSTLHNVIRASNTRAQFRNDM